MLGATSGSEGRGKLAERGCSVRRSHLGHGPGHIPRASTRFLRFQGSVPDPGSTSFASARRSFHCEERGKIRHRLDSLRVASMVLRENTVTAAGLSTSDPLRRRQRGAGQRGAGKRRVGQTTPARGVHSDRWTKWSLGRMASSPSVGIKSVASANEILPPSLLSAPLPRGARQIVHTPMLTCKLQKLRI